MADVFARNEIAFIQEQSSFDVIPNSSGAATVANADACLIKEIRTDADQAAVVRPDKTGSLDAISEQPGRRLGTFSLGLSAAGNGAAGSEPDIKKALKGAFGAAPTINAGTSVVYALGDSLFYLAIWHFLTGLPNATQKVAFNSLVTRLTAEFGGDVPMLSFSGENGWTYDNDQAADGTTPAAAKGGLTAWPSQPSAPVVNGTHPLGFKFTSTIDGNAYTTVRRVRIELAVQRELRKNSNNEFPQSGAPGERMVTGEIVMDDDDSAVLRTMKQKSINNTAVAATFTVGTVAGNRWVWALTGMKLARPRYGEEGVRRTVTFGFRAYPSTINLKDHLTLTIN